MIYDTQGIFSAPRAAFTFSTFGHQNISVLQGGLPRWKAEGFELEHGQPSPFKVSFNPSPFPSVEERTSSPSLSFPSPFLVPPLPSFPQPENYPTPEPTSYHATVPYETVVSNSLQATSSSLSEVAHSSLVLDARAHPRFTGEAPEPRPGLPSGHIPGSRSLPFSELVRDGKLLEDEEVSEREN